ncbi:hypothetical protein D3C77_323210 [compost metagenome]
MGNRNRDAVLRHVKRGAEFVIRLLHQLQLAEKRHAKRAAVAKGLRALALADQGVQIELYRLERLPEYRFSQKRYFRDKHIKRVIDPRNDREADPVKGRVQPPILGESAAGLPQHPVQRRQAPGFLIELPIDVAAHGRRS